MFFSFLLLNVSNPWRKLWTALEYICRCYYAGLYFSYIWFVCRIAHNALHSLVRSGLNDSTVKCWWKSLFNSLWYYVIPNNHFAWGFELSRFYNALITVIMVPVLFFWLEVVRCYHTVCHVTNTVCCIWIIQSSLILCELNVNASLSIGYTQLKWFTIVDTIHSTFPIKVKFN